MQNDSTNASEELELTALQLTDRFQIIELVAQGSSSKVYKAELKQTVAIKKFQKRFASDLSSSDDLVSIERFRREARLAAKLVHPNIVQFSGYGVSKDNEPFIVMEYLEGDSLDKYLQKNGKLSQAETKLLGLEISDALSQVHALGIVHRDVKPANIMVSTDKNSESNLRFRLLDFGIAKNINASDGQILTQANLILGTPDYMSPEQGKAQQLDARSDVYSLGCVLFESVTGRRVFEANSDLAVMQKHLYEDACFEAVDVLDPELKTIILKCLIKNPDERFKSTEELRDALNKLTRLANESEIRRSIPLKVLFLVTVLFAAVFSAAYFYTGKESKLKNQSRIDFLPKKKIDPAVPTCIPSHIEHMDYENIVEEGKNLFQRGQYGLSLGKRERVTASLSLKN